MPGDGAAAATTAASPNLADKLARRAANKRCDLARTWSLWVRTKRTTAARYLQGTSPASCPTLEDQRQLHAISSTMRSSAFHAAVNVTDDPDLRLVEQFGSTRRKRQLTAQEMGAVNPDSIGAGRYKPACAGPTCGLTCRCATLGSTACLQGLSANHSRCALHRQAAPAVLCSACLANVHRCFEAIQAPSGHWQAGISGGDSQEYRYALVPKLKDVLLQRPRSR